MSVIRIGDEATTETMLRPGGIVSLAGQRHSARARTGFIDAGVAVIVAGGGNQGVEVLPADKSPTDWPFPDTDRSSTPPTVTGYGQSIAKMLAPMLLFMRARTLRMRSLGTVFGLAAGVLAASLALGTPDHWFTALQWRDTLLCAGMFLLLGGLGLPFLDDTLDDLDSTFAQFTG